VARKVADKRFLRHDKAASNTLLVVPEILADKNIPVLTQPRYFPD
jgi:hypothetical protein